LCNLHGGVKTKDFKDKVAVITGAASGIGRAIADRCVTEGMKVVLADIEAAPLATAETELKARGGTVLDRARCEDGRLATQ